MLESIKTEILEQRRRELQDWLIANNDSHESWSEKAHDYSQLNTEINSRISSRYLKRSVPASNKMSLLEFSC